LGRTNRRTRCVHQALTQGCSVASARYRRDVRRRDSQLNPQRKRPAAYRSRILALAPHLWSKPRCQRRRISASTSCDMRCRRRLFSAWSTGRLHWSAASSRDSPGAKLGRDRERVEPVRDRAAELGPARAEPTTGCRSRSTPSAPSADSRAVTNNGTKSAAKRVRARTLRLRDEHADQLIARPCRAGCGSQSKDCGGYWAALRRAHACL
jgi:hypothetical protein